MHQPLKQHVVGCSTHRGGDFDILFEKRKTPGSLTRAQNNLPTPPFLTLTPCARQHFQQQSFQLHLMARSWLTVLGRFLVQCALFGGDTPPLKRVGIHTVPQGRCLQRAQCKQRARRGAMDIVWRSPPY